MARVLPAPDSPNAMMMPEMMKEARNNSTATPMPATMPSATLASSPSFGCRL